MTDIGNGNGRGGGPRYSPNITLGNLISAFTTIVSAVSIIVAVSIAYANITNDQGDQARDIVEIKAAIGRIESPDVTKREREHLQKQITENTIRHENIRNEFRALVDGVKNENKSAIDQLANRIDLLGTRTNQTSQDVATLTSEIRNVKEQLQRLDDRERRARLSPDVFQSAPRSRPD